MITTVRNNPKKTIFFSTLLGYACYYSNNKFKEYQYRRTLCQKAMCGADELIGATQELTRITVIHNPVANNRKSGTVFKKDVYPLLNLSGYKVTLAETERPEEGKELMAVLKLEDQDCVCVAGGDGTLMEVVTGLLRREDFRSKMKQIPLVLVPLGSSNSFAKRNNLIKIDDNIGTYDEAVKLIKKRQLRAQNVIELRMVGDQNKEATEKIPKEIFAVSGLEWSVDRDVTKIAKRKWVFGPYRYHWQYLVSALFGKHTKSNKSATLIYQERCSGCSKCVSATSETKNSGSRFSMAYILFPMFFKESIAKDKEKTLEHEEKSKVTNSNCGVLHEKQLSDVRGLSVVLDDNQLKVKVRKNEPDFFAYIKSGVDKLLDNPYDNLDESQENFFCSLLKIIPEKVTDEHYYVDNENLDVVPLELRVLRDAVYFFV